MGRKDKIKKIAASREAAIRRQIAKETELSRRGGENGPEACGLACNNSFDDPNSDWGWQQGDVLMDDEMEEEPHADGDVLMVDARGVAPHREHEPAPASICENRPVWLAGKASHDREEDNQEVKRRILRKSRGVRRREWCPLRRCKEKGSHRVKDQGQGGRGQESGTHQKETGKQA